MTYVHVYFTSGSSVHLRSSAENQSNNVITELPYGYTIAYDYTISPFKHVLVNDGIDVIEGFVHENYLTASNIQCSEDKNGCLGIALLPGNELHITINTIYRSRGFSRICTILATLRLELQMDTTETILKML